MKYGRQGIGELIRLSDAQKIRVEVIRTAGYQDYGGLLSKLNNVDCRHFRDGINVWEAIRN